MRKNKKTVKKLFSNMLVGMTLWELYEMEQAVSDMIDLREEKSSALKRDGERVTELIDKM